MSTTAKHKTNGRIKENAAATKTPTTRGKAKKAEHHETSGRQELQKRARQKTAKNETTTGRIEENAVATKNPTTTGEPKKAENHETWGRQKLQKEGA